MSYFHIAIVLAARGNNGEEGGWMQLLIFLVIAVFWAVGGIAKARANKVTQGDFPEEGPEEGPEGEIVGGEEPQRVPHTRRAYPLRRIDRLRESITLQENKPEEIRAQEPPQEVSLTASPEVEGLSGIDEGVVNRITTVKAEPKETTKQLLRFEDPSDLRRAILHYEILGKPMSLREPGEKGSFD